MARWHRGGTGWTLLYPAGSAKAVLPNVHAACTEPVFWNTSGGLTGGDGLSYGLSLGLGTHTTAAARTAERADASEGGVARVEVRLHLGGGSSLDWLPQKTILFDRAGALKAIGLCLTFT